MSSQDRTPEQPKRSEEVPTGANDPGGVQPASATGAGNPTRTDGAEPVKVGPRRAQYMIAPRVVPGFQPLSADFIAQSLMQSPEITFVKTIPPPRLFGALSADGGDLPSLVLARMTADKAELLQAQAGSSVAVVRDPPLAYVLEPGPEMRPRNPGVLVPHASGFTTTIAVFGPTGPLPEADVFIFGNVFPIQGVTDQSGRVTLKVLGESPDTIRSLYVKPKLDHWSLWLDRPQLTPDAVNRVEVKPLSSHTRGFPGQQLLGWGQRAMGLDQVPASFDGAGVKVVVVDSGAAQTTHRNLGSLGPGISVVGNDPKAWMFDTIGHGSHCAGIIGGGPTGTTGIRGFAPRAEIHVCRIFPGGRFSDLVSALDYCMENGVDIVNLSLGGPENPIVEQRIVRAKEMGIACIVAAGNSSGPVQFPASSPHVLSVGAMGKWGEFPDDSFHSQQALEGFQMRNGYFPASFSCFGPEVDVCAPGVAIISSLPQDSFGAWDGTSMAAPHVSGLAALVLAHHPDFQTALRARDARRVERLFQIIKGTATPLDFGDAHRSGAGLPSAPRALGIRTSAAAGATPSVAAGAPVDDVSAEVLRRLLAMLSGSAAESQAPPQPQPQPLAMGAAAGTGGGRASGNGGVSRGPAAADPQMVQIRSAMKRAGLL